MNQDCPTTLLTCPDKIAESENISLSETRKGSLRVCGFWLKLCYSNQSFGLAGVPCGMVRWYLQAVNQATYRSGIWLMCRRFAESWHTKVRFHRDLLWTVSKNRKPKQWEKRVAGRHEFGYSLAPRPSLPFFFRSPFFPLCPNRCPITPFPMSWYPYFHMKIRFHSHAH